MKPTSQRFDAVYTRKRGTMFTVVKSGITRRQTFKLIEQHRRGTLSSLQIGPAGSATLPDWF